MFNKVRYDRDALRDLFDEMSRTYGIVNLVASFGFCRRWRWRCVELAGIEPGMTVCDFMTGAGECWPFIARKLRTGGKIIGLDFSREMCRRARENARDYAERAPTVLEVDALNSSLGDGSVDAVTACFAIKTLDARGQERFVHEIARVLRPGGRYAVLEISLPPNWLLRLPFRLHVATLVPLIGWLCLGNPENYRTLWRYTAAFGNCDRVERYFHAAGLTVGRARYTFGSATAIFGYKPG